MPESKKLISISEDTFEPFWSPDNRSIGIVSEGKLKRLDLDSNRSYAICATPRLLGGTWNGDVIIFANREGLFKVNSIGGAPKLIVSSDKSRQETVSYPWFLPDARHFLYVVDSFVARRIGNLPSGRLIQKKENGFCQSFREFTLYLRAI